VSGIWHGANWTFVVWGVLHGLFQIAEKMLGLNSLRPKGAGKFLQVIITFAIVDVLWVFFRIPTISEALYVIGKIFADFGNGKLYFGDGANMLYSCMGILMLFAKEISDEFFPARIRLLDSGKKQIRWISAVALFVIIIMTGVFDSGQFIYFQF